MNSLTKIMMGLVLTLLVTTACDKDGEGDLESKENGIENSDLPSNESEAFELITKKWVLSNSTAYNSIELTEDKLYIVDKVAELKSTETANVVITGKFEISADGKTITLIGFGTLAINAVGENSIVITIVLEDGTDLSGLTGDAQEVVASSDKTDMLCKVWVQVIEDVCGEQVEAELFFSKYGTAVMDIVLGESDSDPEGNVLNCSYEIKKITIEWAWKDDSQNILVFKNFNQDEDGTLSDLEFSISLTETKFTFSSVTYTAKN